MIEHIFRNINDIRVFDVFGTYGSNSEPVEIEDVLNVLGYGYTEKIQIEDSVEHLVRQKIIEIEYSIHKSYTGCKRCYYTDKIGWTRIDTHKTHVPLEEISSEYPTYKLATNDVVQCLLTAMYGVHSEDTEKKRKS